jgi:hypothetical protein
MQLGHRTPSGERVRSYVLMTGGNRDPSRPADRPKRQNGMTHTKKDGLPKAGPATITAVRSAKRHCSPAAITWKGCHIRMARSAPENVVRKRSTVLHVAHTFGPRRAQPPLRAKHPARAFYGPRPLSRTAPWKTPDRHVLTANSARDRGRRYVWDGKKLRTG